MSKKDNWKTSRTMKLHKHTMTTEVSTRRPRVTNQVVATEILTSCQDLAVKLVAEEFKVWLQAWIETTQLDQPARLVKLSTKMDSRSKTLEVV